MYAQTEYFFKEFPFLKKHININTLSQKPRVERVDLRLLDSYGYTAEWYVKHDSSIEVVSVHFILFTKEGGSLGEVKQNRLQKFWFWKTKDIIGETVYEKIQKLQNPNQVAYIARIQKGFSVSTFFNILTDSSDTYLVLYKTPASIEFSEWLSQIKEKE